MVSGRRGRSARLRFLSATLLLHAKPCDLPVEEVTLEWGRGSVSREQASPSAVVSSRYRVLPGSRPTLQGPEQMAAA